MPPTRSPFREVTNVARPSQSQIVTRGPLDKLWSSPLDQRARKRRRVNDENESKDAIDGSAKTVKKASSPAERPLDVCPILPTASRRILSNYDSFRAASTRTSRPRHQPISSFPIIHSLVSSHKHDVYRIHSTSDSTFHNGTFDLPISATFSHQSKLGQGTTSLLAVSTNEGKVEIINTSQRAEWDLELPRKSSAPHRGSVFDVKWSLDDTKLATASGDHHSCLLDVETCTVVARFADTHKSSVKQIQWDPYNPHLLASAGRGGSICVWDLRVPVEKTSILLNELLPSLVDAHKPVLTINGAHAEKKKGHASKFGGAVAPSITSILYGKQRENVLYSSSSANGTIKLWDLRQSQAPSQAATEVSTDPFHSSSTSPSNSPAPNSSTSSSRPRGIASLALTPCGSTVYALSSSSHIQSYSALTLSLPESSGPFPEPMGDPRLRVNSFYLRLAVSPCGSWLASGSSSGDVLVWDIARSMRSRGGPVVLSAGAEEGETSSVDWGADGMLATCSDDGTVRTWRPDPVKARECREDLEGSKWNWAVASS